MQIGEVCLLTNDVRRLADFYKKLLEIENDSQDESIQFLITEGTFFRSAMTTPKREVRTGTSAWPLPWRTSIKLSNRRFP